MKSKVLTRSEIASFLDKHKNEASKLYFDSNYTARDLAQHFFIFFTPDFQKECFNILGSKNLGRGGARKNAGNFSPAKKKPKNKKIVVLEFSESEFESLQGLTKTQMKQILLNHKI